MEVAIMATILYLKNEVIVFGVVFTLTHFQNR